MIKCEDADKLIEKSRYETLSCEELEELNDHKSNCQFCGYQGFIGFEVIKYASKKISKKYDDFALGDEFTSRVLDGIIAGAPKNRVQSEISSKKIKYGDLDDTKKL